MSSERSSVMPKNIAIIGLGFMGIALAKSLKNSYQEVVINGYDIDINLLDYLEKQNIINKKYNDLKQLAKDSDIIFLATPTDCFRGIIQDICSVVDGQIIVDIGSIKAKVYNDISALLPKDKNELYVPLHPICGGPSIKHEVKLDEEINRVPANLFEGKIIHFFPQNTDKQNMNIVQNIFKGLKSIINTDLDINQHDNVYALTSHLPMFLVVVFLSSIRDEKNKSYDYFTNKILDKMWLPIFINNINNIKHWLEKISLKLPDIITTNNLSTLLQDIVKNENLSTYVGDGYKRFIEYKDDNICVNKQDFEKYKSYLLHFCEEQNTEVRLSKVLSMLNKKILNRGQDFCKVLSELDKLIDKPQKEVQ